jgi:hypothetical protein
MFKAVARSHCCKCCAIPASTTSKNGKKRLQNHHAKNAGFDRINTAVFKQSAFVKDTSPEGSRKEFTGHDTYPMPPIVSKLNP